MSMVEQYKKHVGTVAPAIDNAIKVVFPKWALARKQARIGDFMATYEGAKPGRYRSNAGTFQNLSSQDSNLNGLGRIRMMAEARDLEDNTGFVLGINRMFSKYAVGDIRAQSRTGDPEIDKVYEKYFNDWCKVCDFSGRHSFISMCQLALMAVKRDGDIGFIKIRKDGFPFPQLQAIESDRIGSPYDFTVTKKHVGGVVLDDSGRPVGYRIYNRGASGISFIFAKEEPAQTFLHVLDPLRFDQYRGVTAYQAAVNSLRDVKEILEFEKVGVKWASSQAAVIEKQNGMIGTDVPLLDEVNGDGNTDKMETFSAGVVNYLAPGEVFKAFTADRPSQGLTNFIPLLIKEISIGLELPPSFVWDMAGLGGVPARFESQLAKRTFQRIQGVLRDRFLDPVWAWVIADGIEYNGLPAHENFGNVRWQFPAHPTVDVGRESKANLDENRQGLKSASTIYGEQGQDWEEEIEQIAKEAVFRKEMAEKYDIDPMEIRMLTPNGNGTPPAEQGEPQKPGAKPGNDSEKETEED